MVTILDVASAVFGFVGSILLVVSAWRGAPFRRTIDLGAEIKKSAILGDLAQKDVAAAKRQLSEVMSLEPRFIIAGASALGIGFLCSLIKVMI